MLPQLLVTNEFKICLEIADPVRVPDCIQGPASVAEARQQIDHVPLRQPVATELDPSVLCLDAYAGIAGHQDLHGVGLEQALQTVIGVGRLVDHRDVVGRDAVTFLHRDRAGSVAESDVTVSVTSRRLAAPEDLAVGSLS